MNREVSIECPHARQATARNYNQVERKLCDGSKLKMKEEQRFIRTESDLLAKLALDGDWSFFFRHPLFVSTKFREDGIRSLLFL